MPRVSALLASPLLAALVACSATGDSSDPCPGGKCDDLGGGVPGLCAAVRGNGQLITAHFASLARIVEHYGLIEGASGGSSGSITLFITESVQMNPQVHTCGKACPAAERDARAALLLKSFPGYLDALGTSEEAAALGVLSPLASRLRTDGIEALLETDVPGAVEALLALLESEDLRELVNPEVLDLLRRSPDPAFHARDVLASIQSLGSFEADDPRILLRPGLLDFEGLAELLGRAGSFYAGYGPVDEIGMEQFLSACATPGRGLPWTEVAALPAGATTCGALLSSLVADYREAFRADRLNLHSRIDDPVGAYLPALVSTSVLVGEGAEAWRRARADYLDAVSPVLEVPFDDVRFGYFGRAADLERAGENRRGFTDDKTARFFPIGEATWREALAYSPAEPGLARALELDADLVSAGGWSDLHPTLALKNLGCEQVVYVTRAGDESNFAQGVARLLGMSEAERVALYDLDHDSAYARSIAEADGVWCTNWNDIPATEIARLTDDAYNAPLEARGGFFSGGADPYPGARASAERRGCTPGF